MPMAGTERNTEYRLEQLSALGIPGEDADQGLKDLCAQSSSLELSLLDYLTIRDLLDLSGRQGDVFLWAVLIALFAAMEEGSLCVDLEEAALTRRLMRFLAPAQARLIARSFLASLSRGTYQGFIAKNRDAYLPLVVSEARGRSLLYFQKFYACETRLRHRMESLLRAKPPTMDPEQDEALLIDGIYGPELSICAGRKGAPIRRDAKQTEAIQLALRSRFCIVSGGPGTGKTSLMVNMLRCFVRTGIAVEDILLGAPTGRAAQRMTEAIQQAIHTIACPAPCDRDLLNLKGSTLHKLLRYRRSRHDFYYSEANPLPASVIILDEVSMVDVIMMERFLRAVDPAKTRLVLMGDKDQLPSVEAGAVFAEMIPDGTRAKPFKGRLVVLETVYRSGRNLNQLAREINQGNLPTYRPLFFPSALALPEDQWAIVPDEGISAWRQHVRMWAAHHYLSAGRAHDPSLIDLTAKAGEMDAHRLLHSDEGQFVLDRIFEGVRQARILSLVRKGIYGCTGINREISGQLAPTSGHPGWIQKGWFPGAIIMITRNDYARELYNGDVGVVIMDGEGACRAFFPRFGSYAAFSMETLPPWEPAFAVTVHKSQGSEFDNVLLVLPPDEAHRLLTREIVYTGVTRARKRLIIHAKASVLKKALTRRIERESGLGW